MSDTPILEAVLFKTKDGVDEAEFITTLAGLDAELEKMSGYIRREFFKDENGQWLDFVYWRSMEEAHQAAEAIMHVPNALKLFEMLDQTSLTMLHLNQIHRSAERAPLS